MKLIKTDEEKSTNTNLKLRIIELKKNCDKKYTKNFTLMEKFVVCFTSLLKWRKKTLKTKMLMTRKREKRKINNKNLEIDKWFLFRNKTIKERRDYEFEFSVFINWKKDSLSITQELNSNDKVLRIPCLWSFMMAKIRIFNSKFLFYFIRHKKMDVGKNDSKNGHFQKQNYFMTLLKLTKEHSFSFVLSYFYLLSLWKGEGFFL